MHGGILETMQRALLLTLLAASAACLLLSGGCKDGGSPLLISPQNEVELGRTAADDFEKEVPLSRDAELNNKISRIGRRVAAAAETPQYPYEFKVIDNETVNAAAFPGGRIYVYRGLVDKFNGDEDMLAWVLGHEVAHVASRHSGKRIERQLGVATVAEMILGRSTAAQIAIVASELVFRDYGRDNELEADRKGLEYANKAGYDPTAAIAVINVFQSMSGGKDPDKMELLFMTHPGDTTRLDQIKDECVRHGYRGKYYP